MAALVLHAARRGSLRAFTTASGRVRAAAVGGTPVDGDVGGAPAEVAVTGPGGFQAPRRPVLVDPEQSRDAQETRVSPEFIRPPSRTNPLLFHLQRRDMERRRRVLAIPDFYPGSVLAVTLSDALSPGRVRRFVGICLKRSGSGLGATATLRNVIEGQGVELVVELYNPRVHLIEVLRLEQRLDDDLSYLRDALPSYSCFPDSGGGGAAPLQTSSGNAVPMNTTVVEMLPRPWSRRWGSELRGASLPAPPTAPRTAPRGHGRKHGGVQRGEQRVERPWKTMDLKAARHSQAQREAAARSDVAKIRAEMEGRGKGDAGRGSRVE